MKVTVLGPGSWGLTVAWLLHKQIDDLWVWGLPQFINPIANNRKVEKPVIVTIPDSVSLTSDLNKAVSGSDIVLFVVPSDAVRAVAHQLKKTSISSSTPLVSLAKGFELSTLLRMSEVLKQELPDNPALCLSGPTLAAELLAGKPTAASIACEDIKIAEYVQKALNNEQSLRLYTNQDIIGVELGGSLKNVIAIASGFAYSLGLGHNAIGALITRGLAETVRLSVAMGATPHTLYGLSGTGDLIATCNSPTSRNYKVGYALAQGKDLNYILENLGSVAEGVKTAEAVQNLAKKYNVEMPISNEVLKLIRGEVTPQGAIKNMMSRSLKSEELYTTL